MSLKVEKQQKLNLGLSIPLKRTPSKMDCDSSTDIYENISVLDNPESNKSDKQFFETKFNITFSDGGTFGSLEKETEGVKNPYYGGGIRNVITDLSISSRRNLLKTMYQINKNKIDKGDVKFITLTYDENTDKNKLLDGITYKRHLKNLTHSITRKYGGFGVWRFELQKRLVGHFHLLWYRVTDIDIRWISKRWNEITNGSETHLMCGVDIETPKSWKGISLYGSKVIGYIGKIFKGNQEMIQHMKDICCGRLWGVVNRDNMKEYIDSVVVELTEVEYTKIKRVYKRLLKSWKLKTGNIKNWVKMKKWFGSWDRLKNITLDFFMECEIIMKLIGWVKNLCSTDTKIDNPNTDNTHDDFNKLNLSRSFS